jgi:hypothetical protein
VIATCGDFNFDSLDERIERRRIVWTRERPGGDRAAEGAADGVAYDVTKWGAEERVAWEHGGALSSVWRGPSVCHG